MSYIIISSILSGALLFCIIKYYDLFSYFNLLYRLLNKSIKKSNKYYIICFFYEKLFFICSRWLYTMMVKWTNNTVIFDSSI